MESVLITEQIPEPEDSGSSGTQVRGTTSGTSLVLERVPVGRPLEQAIVGLASTNSRNMGGEFGATLLAGSFSQISLELAETKEELKKCRSDLESSRTKLEQARVNIATINGKLTSVENEKAIRSVCLVAGTAVVGFGIDQVRGNQLAAGWILIGVGIALALVGWFSVGRRAVK